VLEAEQLGESGADHTRMVEIVRVPTGPRPIAAQILRWGSIIGIPLFIWISVYYALWGPLPRGDSRWISVVSNLALFLVGLAAFAALYRPHLIRILERELAWLVAGEAPSPEAAESLARLPGRIASSLFRSMAVVAFVTAALNLGSQREPLDSLRVLVGLGLTACLVGALGYLIAERALRPAFAVGLTGLRGRGGAVGVRRRLELAWALGSGIPFLFILAIPLGHGDGVELPSDVPAVVMAGLGVFLGVVTTVVVARSVSDPLDGLRAAFERVEAGDLDTSVAIDDPGEIGRLQAGFDRMVTGLRERRQLEDLFGRHVGIDVARHALDAGIRLGGERREVSVFFIDVKGSTLLSETMAPEAIVDRLNTLFTAVVDAATAEGGWINKFEGDAALAVFGAPAIQADHAARALRAARKLRAVLDTEERRGGLPAAIGVASGIAVAGNVGAEERYEYTVIGRPVNEAARLTELAKESPSGLLASGDAITAAQDEAAHWSHVESVTLRGLVGATDVFTCVEKTI
jgi:adenylate cyclase